MLLTIAHAYTGMDMPHPLIKTNQAEHLVVLETLILLYV